MKIDFNSEKEIDKREYSVKKGNSKDMMKKRKEELPKLQATIQDALADYKGEAIAIIKVIEDKDGFPRGNQTVITGVTRFESQIDLAKALSKASDSALEVLVESVKGDTRALLQVAAYVAKRAGAKVKREEK